MRAPDELRDLIARDLRPVTPLRRPIRRAISLVPFALGLLVASVAVFGLRGDAARLGWLLTWGASAAEAMLGLTLSAAALREAVPGTPLPRRALGTLLATAALAVVALTWLTWLASPTRVGPQNAVFVWQVCFGAMVLTALPPLALAGGLVARAFPLRAPIAGALYGLGAGFMADAGWRLFCHFSEPLHVLGSHTLGIAAAAAIGLAAATRMKRAD